MFEEKFNVICKLLYKLNLFDSVKCNVLPTSVTKNKIKYPHGQTPTHTCAPSALLWYSIQEFNKTKNLSSSIGICHTNIASLSKHIEELKLTLSLLRNEFHVIAITEHKIRKGVEMLANIDIPGYKPFIFDSTATTHGGTEFYVNESLQLNIRDDLKFNSHW